MRQVGCNFAVNLTSEFMNRTLVLAIGNAAANIVHTVRKESEHPSLISARYIFADCNDRSFYIPHLHLDAEDPHFPSSIFSGFSTVCIVAGMGGETGTKYTEIAARKAVESGARNVIAFVTTPFRFEGEQRNEQARRAVSRLKKNDALTVVTFDNNYLCDNHPDMNFLNAFELADHEIMAVMECELGQ